MMKKVSQPTYATFVGGMGFTRNVDYELTDMVKIQYKDHVGTVMATAIYYADYRGAEYAIREVADGG